MSPRYCIRMVSPEGFVSYLTVNNRMSWTKARATFQMKSSSVLKHFEGYTFALEEE